MAHEEEKDDDVIVPGLPLTLANSIFFFYRKVRKTKTMWEICLLFVAAIYTLVS